MRFDSSRHKECPEEAEHWYRHSQYLERTTCNFQLREWHTTGFVMCPKVATGLEGIQDAVVKCIHLYVLLTDRAYVSQKADITLVDFTG